MLIVTFRPEFRHAWGGQPQVTVLALNQLGGSDSAVLVEGLAGNAGLSREIVDEILSAPLACHCSSKSFITHKSFPVPPGSDAPTVTRCGFVQSASSRR